MALTRVLLGKENRNVLQDCVMLRYEDNGYIMHETDKESIAIPKLLFLLSLVYNRSST